MNRFWKALLVINLAAVLLGAYAVATYFPRITVGGDADIYGNQLYLGRSDRGDAGIVGYGLWVNGSGKALMTSVFQVDEQTRTMVWADRRGVSYGCLEALMTETGPVWRTFTGCETDTGQGGLTWEINAPLDVNYNIDATTISAAGLTATPSALLGGNALVGDCNDGDQTCIPVTTYADAVGRSVVQYDHVGTACLSSTVTASAVDLNAYTNCAAGTGTIPMSFNSAAVVKGKLAVNEASGPSVGSLETNGGASFTNLPANGTVSLGVINSTAGWSGTGLLATNQSSGSRGLMVVYNNDVAYIGSLTAGAGVASMVVDNVNNRIGIGDVSPLAMLTVGNGDLIQMSSVGDVRLQNNITLAGSNAVVPACAADGDVGFHKYIKGTTTSVCVCWRNAGAYTLTAVGGGDCT